MNAAITGTIAARWWIAATIAPELARQARLCAGDEPDLGQVPGSRGAISGLAEGCPVRIRLDRPAFGDFYLQAFNGSVSLPVAGYNYNSGWISFCWWDLHPLEWQLASLHGQKAKYSQRADVFRSSTGSGH